MGFDLDTIALDSAAEVEGVWEEFHHPVTGRPTGLRVRIARFGNPKFKEIYKGLKERVRRLPNGELPDKVHDRIFAEAMARAIVVDWSGMIRGGVDVPYSVEEAKTLLLDNARPAFREFVSKVAGEEANYYAAELEADTESLKNVSGGSLNTGRLPKNPPSKSE
jgi:hypothetical protein